jgi:hypothetical protein
MKNILKLLLSRTIQVSGLALVTVMIAGCDAPEDLSTLDVHSGTMNSYSTYTIHYEEIRIDSEYFYSNNVYVYVDNMSDRFIVSDNQKTNVALAIDDFLFEVSDDKVFGYTNEDVWLRYEVKNDLLNAKNFEAGFFRYVKDGMVRKDDDIVTYTKHLAVEDLGDDYVNLLGVDIPHKYENIDFVMTASYSVTEDRFTSFKMDFTPVLEVISDDINKTLPEGATWEVNIGFDDINLAYTINAPDYTDDDYLNDFSYNSLLGLTTQHSYELFEGSVNYTDDQDIFSVIVDSSQLYKIYIRELSNHIGLNIKILDSHLNVFKEITIDENDKESDYYNFDKGEYYLVVTSDSDNCEGTGYSFLFLTH